MPFSKTALLIFSTLAALSSALPGSHRSEIDLPISPRDETTIHPVTCYGRSYTPAELSAAVAEGCRQEQKNKNRRRSGYPHWYKNREGIAFQVQASKYMEYPILYSGEIYPGYGIPGPDRVVFVSESCIYAGAMTHDGAPADHPNWFVACT
ncbi:hypothetical protein M0657_012205 [Pyricularia oryzae]|nr:hypothetical protein M0657_012205 [Pyricularia oryzae]KAI7908690.1 hypothetical protein M9X92_012048 [Pyricularia oryzae]